MPVPRPLPDLAIRLAAQADVPAIEELIRAAYTGYIERIGAPPGPMLDDYAARVSQLVLWVGERDGRIVGLVVLVPKEDCLYLDNIAIDPDRQGQGFGHALMRFAEDRARRANLPEMRLFTHQTMDENIALYARTGWLETARHRQDGYDRVFFRKPVPAAP